MRIFPHTLFAATVIAIALVACPTPPDTGCVNGVGSKECAAQCARLGSCSLCAAAPDCGWCVAASGGLCLPSTLGEDHRNQRPPACQGDWLYRTSDPSVPQGAPFCPAILAGDASTPPH